MTPIILTAIQTLVGLVGTWFLAFGLKSVQETRMFDAGNPHPVSWRFWLGLILLTLAALPSLVVPFVLNR